MIRFFAFSASILRMIPRLGALAMVVATATVSVGCVAGEVDEPAEADADTDEELGAAEEALSIRCHVCNPGVCEPGVFCTTDCYTDYCTAGLDYCDPEVGCVPYP